MVMKDYETIELKDPTEWRTWLELHNADTDGVWIRLFKKASGIATVTNAEALDVALCYGWIDGQRKSFDGVSYLQKYTPRRKTSLWSKRNIEHIARLEAAGLMTPAGLAEVTRAKEDGRWEAAYDSPSNMTPPEYLITELQKHPKAKEFYKTLNKTNTFAISFKLRTAKTEATQKRRLDKIIEMLNAEQKLY